MLIKQEIFEIPKMSPSTSVFENFWIQQFCKILSCYRHFHYDNVMIIKLYVSSTNSTIYHHLKVLLYILYIVSYCTDNSL